VESGNIYLSHSYGNAMGTGIAVWLFMGMGNGTGKFTMEGEWHLFRKFVV